MNEKLTGRTRYRNHGGLIILQVEYTSIEFDNMDMSAETITRRRDAKVEDISLSDSNVELSKKES